MAQMIEKVLEIEIKNIDEKYSYARVIYQNYDVLKRGDFFDIDLKVASCSQFYIGSNHDTLFINGDNIAADDEPFIIKNELIPTIIERVAEINDKYGIRKRWRAKNGEIYYYIDDCCSIVRSFECETVVDNKRYGYGNYFKTAREAEMSVIYEAFQQKKDSN